MKTIEPLTGEDLLKKVKDLGNLSKEEKARECGYYTKTKNGVDRVNMMKFLNALIAPAPEKVAFEQVNIVEFTFC